MIKTRLTEMFGLALEYQPRAVMLSFGDPTPYASLIRSAGCKLICQVQDLEGARIAHETGAHIIVAQGSEAGGHGASRAKWWTHLRFDYPRACAKICPLRRKATPAFEIHVQHRPNNDHVALALFFEIARISINSVFFRRNS